MAWSVIGKNLTVLGVVFLGFWSLCLTGEFPTPAPGVVCPVTDCSSCPWGEVKSLNTTNNCSYCACKQKLCQTPSCEHQCRFGRVKDGDNCLTCQCIEPICKPPSCSKGFPKCPENAAGATYFQLPNGCESCRCRTRTCSNIVCNATERCEFGHRRDGYGCSTCDCLDAACPELDCDPECDDTDQDYEIDAAGCKTCNCVDKPEEGCGQGLNCTMCDHGFVFNTKGCKTCMCKNGIGGKITYTDQPRRDEL